ncbi:MAG: tRNA glutamyl-Q(34) synthetase GluQRS [Methylovulum sp.]|nr:tRNA glutamyl-Q(34) synthetase GluQRS [Methylovulum sp.]
MSDQQPAIGRFAPSPTGPLHLGSLSTALASFLQTRSQQGLWLLRIDDLDTPRNIKGAADAILTALDTLGLHWDSNVDYQSQHNDEYHDWLSRLDKNGQLYPCACPRKLLLTDIYPGTCRHRQLPPDSPYALRVKTDPRDIAFQDGLQGFVSHNLATRHGDFILKRKDQIIAYQFAVVIDDHRQQVNQVVRGIDLLEVTPRQIYLQQLLGLTTPAYMHLPIIVDHHGYKLSKQTKATAVDLAAPHHVIFTLLRLLKQNPPAELQQAPVTDQLTWAIAHWNPATLKNLQSIGSP